MTESRCQRTATRRQKSEDKGKKVRGWEGPKVRRKPQAEIGIPITFSLYPFAYQLNQLNQSCQLITHISPQPPLTSYLPLSHFLPYAHCPLRYAPFTHIPQLATHNAKPVTRNTQRATRNVRRPSQLPIFPASIFILS